MTLNKAILKTLAMSLIITLDVMASQSQKYYEQHEGSTQYYHQNLGRKTSQQEKRKTIYREPFRKCQPLKANEPLIEKIYEDLKNTEENLIYPTTEDVSQFNNALIKQVKLGRQINRQIRGLNFKGISFDQSIGNMISILQTKLDCIGNVYQPHWLKTLENSEDEEDADPYYANLCIDYNNKIYYHFTLNYNGGSQTATQPGNSVIRQSVSWGNKDRTSCSIGYSKEDYFNYLQKNEDLKGLLFALEVARRKVVDKCINLQDKYANLPIYCASIMAIALINDKHISETDFWVRGGKYHMYSGEETARDSGIKNIIRKFTEIYKVYDVKQLLKIIE